MEWEGARRSDNIEDLRGDGGGGGGGLGIPVGGGGLGIGAIIILALIGYATGIDPRVLIGGAETVVNHGQSYNGQNYGGQGYQRPTNTAAHQGAPKDQMGDFVAAVLGETEDVWTQVLPQQKGVQYVDPRLVLYSGVTHSGCGQAQSAMGPFYCPVDRKVYLDMSFFNDMRQKLGGGGDFAYAYVVAHEIGHHVQNLLGILPKVHQAQEQGDEAQSNALSVKLELQADCLAGVWAANADQKWHILQQGDVDKALNTAEAIGDDRLQESSRGYAVPDSFTHGTSAQRKQWLTTGLRSGKVDSCNTFARQ
jgi:uncharacterized protein